VVESTLKNARFKVDNEFSGAGGGDGASSKPRAVPVQFDKEDVFGLDDFMQVLVPHFFSYVPFSLPFPCHPRRVLFISCCSSSSAVAVAVAGPPVFRAGV